MKNTICVIVLFSIFLSINSTFAQKKNTCEVVVWKGRKAHYTAEKIALYTGKDVKNPAVALHEGRTYKTQAKKYAFCRLFVSVMAHEVSKIRIKPYSEIALFIF